MPRWRAFDGRRSRVWGSTGQDSTTEAHMRMITAFALALAGAILFTACTRDVEAIDARQIEQRYGVSGAYTDTIATMAGAVCGALRGSASIPEAWRAKVERVASRDQAALARELIGVGRDKAAAEAACWNLLAPALR